MSCFQTKILKIGLVLMNCNVLYLVLMEAVIGITKLLIETVTRHEKVRMWLMAAPVVSPGVGVIMHSPLSLFLHCS
jgi:hypothetical protein